MKVSSAGFEPTAYRLGICRSIHLSYEDKLDCSLKVIKFVNYYRKQNDQPFAPPIGILRSIHLSYGCACFQ